MKPEKFGLKYREVPPKNGKLLTICEADPPMTKRMTWPVAKKHWTREDGFKGYYYMTPMRNKRLSVKKSEQFYPTFNEAMRALILNIEVG